MKHEKGKLTGESVEQTGGNKPRVILARVQAGGPARERLEEPIGRLGRGCGGGRGWMSTRALPACWCRFTTFN